MKLSHVPLRVTTGVFFLNSGLGKRQAPRQQAEMLHSMATAAVPAVEQIEPEPFTRALSASETALGVALVAPVVPSWLAGLGLTAFSIATLRLYLNAPGMTEEDSVRPTQEGIGVAKDLWMLGIGLALIIDDLRS